MKNKPGQLILQNIWKNLTALVNLKFKFMKDFFDFKIFALGIKKFNKKIKIFFLIQLKF